MTFSAIESSEDLGQPAGLVKFIYGTSQTTEILYTDQEFPVTFQGKVYNPVPFEHSNIKSTGKPDKTSFSFKLPANADICKLYYKRPPSTPVTMVIYQGHVNDTFSVSWSGRVQTVSFSGSKATLTCEPATISLQRTGLRLRWQVSCPHVLYSTSCKATLNWVPVTVASKSKYQIVINEAIPNPVRYIGGMARWVVPEGYIYSPILRANDVAKSIDLGHSTELVATNVEIAFGCDKSLTYCNSVFNNGPNYGGAPFIPTKNPLNRSLRT